MTLGFEKHNHAACIAGGLKTAEAYCADKGIRLTAARKKVLGILLENHSAMGAYEILDRLRDEGQNAQPPVAYRALEFLQKHGFVHKIERLNAFIACASPDQGHAPAFLICRECDQVAEAHTAVEEGRLGKLADQAGFAIEKTVVEAVGLCPNCQEAPSA